MLHSAFGFPCCSAGGIQQPTQYGIVPAYLHDNRLWYDLIFPAKLWHLSCRIPLGVKLVVGLIHRIGWRQGCPLSQTGNRAEILAVFTTNCDK
jgi:hypothetical protein